MKRQLTRALTEHDIVRVTIDVAMDPETTWASIMAFAGQLGNQAAQMGHNPLAIAAQYVGRYDEMGEVSELSAWAGPGSPPQPSTK